MERLQAAIQKARQDYGGSHPSRDTTAAQEIEEKWKALPMVDLKKNVLQRNLIFAAEANMAATSFDILRTRTLRHMQEQGWKRIAITSPTPSCGKSTISLNLAFAMARQPNTRTIQIEMDMRQPSQETLLGIRRKRDRDAPNQSLSGLLSGEVEFADVGRRYGGTQLAMATNAKGVKNASDLLLSDQVTDTLKNIEDTYQPDIMIFDMPPMLVNDDTLAFKKHVDCVLIVAAAEQTTVAEIDKCERELASQTNVLGVVLNKCRLQSKDGRYGYNYSYGS